MQSIKGAVRRKLECHVFEADYEYIDALGWPRETVASTLIEIFVQLLWKDLVPFLKRYLTFDELMFLCETERHTMTPDLDIDNAIGRTLRAVKTNRWGRGSGYSDAVIASATDKLKRLTPAQHAGLLALAWALRNSGWGRKNRLANMTRPQRMKELLDLHRDD